MYLSRVTADILGARKAREELKVRSLTMLKSKLLDNSKAPKPKEDLAIIRSYVKQVGESLDAYSKDKDKYAKEIADAQAEIEYVKAYLPEELSEDAIRTIVKTIRDDSGEDLKFGIIMGKVMQYMKKHHDGQADGKLVKKAVDDVLSLDA